MSEMDAFFCEGSATVMTDYHICRYDPVLGVLVCVGDDCDVLVVGRNMCRRHIPVRRGVHWLDCFLYAGTSSILLLSPEGLECVSYGSCTTDSVLSVCPAASKLTCLHVPQGLTCGAVGRRNGVVGYFRLCDVDETTHHLFWVVKETNVLELAQPFVEADDPVRRVTATAKEEEKFFPFGSILALDSLPENPNTFIGVVAGVPGVVEWSVSAGKVSTFFSARHSAALNETNIVAACQYTPGGNFVVATTTDSSHVLVWDMGQKKKAKVSEVYWVVNLSESISHDIQTNTVEAFQFNEYRVNIYMARTNAGGGSVSDKNSQWYLLLNGQRDIVEVVLRVEDKEVVDQEQVIADLNVYTARKGIVGKTRDTRAQDGMAANFFKVFHVEPCTPHCYWKSELTDFDLDSLIITSSGGLHPLVVKRKRSARGLESIQELKEINGEAPWSQCLLLRLPFTEKETLLRNFAAAPHHSAMDELLFGSATLIDVYKRRNGSSLTEISQEKRVVVEEALVATVVGWGEAVLLSPATHQVLRLDPVSIQETTLWAALYDKTSTILLEEALPARTTQLSAELLLRVTVSADQVMVTKFTIRLGVGRTFLALDRSNFGLRRSGSSDMVRRAKLGDAKMERTDAGRVQFSPHGMCLVLVLEDSSIAFLDLSGKTDPTTREPIKFVLPAADFLPAETTVCAVETFWGTTPAFAEEAFYVVALLENGAGLLVWNMSTTQMHLYPQFSAPATHLLIEDAAPPSIPNISGDIPMFSVDLAILIPPTEPREFGLITMSDAAGGELHRIHIGFGLVEDNCRVWCIRTSKDPSNVWRPTGFCLDVKRITLSCTLVENQIMEWKYSSDAGGEMVEAPQGKLKGVLSYIRATWPIGKALLYTQVQKDSVPKRQVLVEATGKPKLQSSSPIIVLRGLQHVASVDISAMLRRDPQRRDNDAVPTIRLDSSRSLEEVSLCGGFKRLLAISRDDNGWRWINVIDVYTLKPCMTPFATLDFAGEEHLKVLQVVQSERNEVHLYLVGATNGAIGHYILSSYPQHHKKAEELIAVDPCWPKHYDPAPGSFRWYHRYLPRRPTQKAESNFFKRLMSSPWEDIAEELVSTTFQQVRRSGEREPEPPKPAVAPQPAVSQHVDALHLTREAVAKKKSSPTSILAPMTQPEIRVAEHVPSAAPSTQEAPGSRYAQLKALAQRENVSLIEARRMMSENVKKLQERAERLGRVENKSEELASRAMTFQDLARQLKEKKRNSWL